MSDKKLYREYRRVCKQKGLEPLPYERWKGPEMFKPIDKFKPKGDEMTYEEAAEKLGYKSKMGVVAQMNKGNIESDGQGGVTDESVEKLLKAKEAKKLEDVTVLDDDDQLIVTTKGELKKAFVKWSEENQKKMQRVTADEILKIIA